MALSWFLTGNLQVSHNQTLIKIQMALVCWVLMPLSLECDYGCLSPAIDTMKKLSTICMMLAIASAASIPVLATAPPGTTTNAPDAGASVALLALGSLGLMGFRRFISKR